MAEKIKVLHLIKSLGRGGAEMLIPETLRVHNQARFEFHCIYFLPWKNQMVEPIRDAGASVTCMQASNNLVMLLRSRGVARYIAQHGIQIVHCHLPWAGVVGRLIRWLTGIPTLYTEHNKQERYHWLTRWVNRWTFQSQDAVITVSSDVAQSIRQNIGKAVPIIEIPNGVNTDYFQRDADAGRKLRVQLGIPEHALVIGTIAVFRFQKRLGEWLQIMAAISRKHTHVYGIMVGDGPLKNELLSQRRELGLEEKVLMPGLQTDVKPWLSAFDVFMMSSVFEGLPIALLEAMSMQCAIVATDAGGVKEVIQHGTSGLLVESQKWSKLEDEVERIIADLELHNQLALGARKRVVEHFGVQRMVDQLEAAYIQLIR